MSTMDAAGTLARLVRAQRTELGLTQEELARRARLSVRALRDIELGRVTMPRDGALRGLAGALGLELDALAPTRSGRIGPLRLGVLGPLVVRRGDAPVPLSSPVQRGLLGLLCLHCEATVTRDEIIDVLWGTDPPRTCHNQIHVHIGRLRRRLDLEPSSDDVPGPRLVTAGGGYRLVGLAEHLDLARFDRLAGGSEPDPERLREALGLWRGPVLADASERLRQHPATVAAHRRRVAVAIQYADAALAAGRYVEVEAVLSALLEYEPLHEGLHARIMLALAGSGDQAAALRTFGGIRDRLRDELGIEPGPELREAQLRVLRQEVAGSPPPSGRASRSTDSRPSRPAQLPRAVPGFAGRETELARLDATVAAAPVIAITGTAGVGKTALAVHWAHRIADRYPDGQLYADLRGFDRGGAQVEPAEALRGFLDALGVPAAKAPSTVDAQAALYRTLVADRRMLIVLDNAREATQVRPLLPGGAGCAVIVTSRHRLPGLVTQDGAVPLPLEPMSAAAARKLLLGRLSVGLVEADPSVLDEIIAWCGGLPLALSIMAARIAIDPRNSLAALTRPPAARLDILDGGDDTSDIRSVLSWSYRALTAGGARLFRQLGLTAGPDIGATAVASLAGLPMARAQPLLRELLLANLVSEPVPGRYALHDVLREYAAELAEKVDPGKGSDAALHRLWDHYLHTGHRAAMLLFPQRVPLNLPAPRTGAVPAELSDLDSAMAWFDDEYRVMVAAIQQTYARGADRYTWRLAWTLATYFLRRGHGADYLATQEAALAAAIRLDDRSAQAYAHGNLGVQRARSGDLDAGEQHLQQALRLHTEVDEAIGRAHTLLHLGFVWELRGDDARALDYSEQALAVATEAGARSAEGLALDSIAWFSTQLGDLDRAVDLSRRVIALHEEMDHLLGQARGWATLGITLHRLDRDAEALDCLSRAVDMFRQIGDEYGEADALVHMGDARQASDDPAGAREAWRRALAIFESLDHPEASEVRRRLQD